MPMFSMGGKNLNGKKKQEFSVKCVCFMRCIWRFQLDFNIIFLFTVTTTVLA